MTDDNQTTEEIQENETPQFGSGGKQEPEKRQLSEEDIEKILSRNSHAQQHIKTLESETAELRQQLRDMQEQLGKSKSIDDLLDAMQQQDMYENSNQPGPTAPQIDTNELLAKLKDEVFSELNAVQRKELEEKNWRETEDLLKSQYGDRYAHYVDERAKELDMTNSEMETLARTKPKAFMELLGSAKKTSTPSPTQSSQRSFSNTGTDVESMYGRVQRLRKENTEEGREARRMWDDPAFQARFRQHTLEKARSEGKF